MIPLTLSSSPAIDLSSHQSTFAGSALAVNGCRNCSGTVVQISFRKREAHLLTHVPRKICAFKLALPGGVDELNVAIHSAAALC
jgi:hypothetical protein